MYLRIDAYGICNSTARSSCSALQAGESTLGLINNIMGVILPGIAFGIPFAVIVLYTFLLAFPREMEEAAIMDGASHMRIFFQLVVPIARSAFITVALFQIVVTWNEFLFAFLILTDDDVKIITVGLAGFQGEWASDWGTIMAAVIISVIPLLIIYIMFQKYLINSLGGMSKG